MDTNPNTDEGDGASPATCWSALTRSAPSSFISACPRNRRLLPEAGRYLADRQDRRRGRQPDRLKRRLTRHAQKITNPTNQQKTDAA